MIDRLVLYVKAGDGGDGSVSFRRERFVPKGGPDGGDGGRGGDVILMAGQSYYGLTHLRGHPHVRAGHGGKGEGALKHGKRAEDVVVPVPLGTVLYREGAKLGELLEQGQKMIVARGGRGGRGNRHFATSVHRTPRFAEYGGQGDEFKIELELKLVADVAIIGLPNVGKSTFLAAVSDAQPAIADYPFTTVEPQLGVAEVDYRQIVFMDVPGLIEGASEGVGLGDEFLRHIQRARVLLHLVAGNSPHPTEDIAMINEELEAYDPALLQRPTVLVVNKIDLPEASSQRAKLERELRPLGQELFFISAATGEGVPNLVRRVSQLVAEAERFPVPPVEADDYEVFRPEPVDRTFGVHQVAGKFVLQGSDVPDLVVTRQTSPSEYEYVLRERLRRTHWRRRLEQAGVKPGDKVVVGGTEIEW